METMTPSTSITAGQIGKIQELIGAGLRKSGLPSEPAQQVIEHRGDSIVAECVAVIRKFVEAISGLIVRHVSVNRARTPEETLKATGRKQYTDSSVVATMPNGEGDEVDVVFFKPDLSKRNGYISDDDLEKEFQLRGLVPIDPYSLASVNEADPTFADERPNGTHWKDKNGKWCYAAFSRWSDGRSVHVDRSDDVWFGFWWFAGRRK